MGRASLASATIILSGSPAGGSTGGLAAALACHALCHACSLENMKMFYKHIGGNAQMQKGGKPALAMLLSIFCGDQAAATFVRN